MDAHTQEWMHTPATNHENNWTMNDPCKDNNNVMRDTWPFSLHPSLPSITPPWKPWNSVWSLSSKFLFYHSLYIIPCGIHGIHGIVYRIHMEHSIWIPWSFHMNSMVKITVYASIPYGLHMEHMGEHKVHSYSVIMDIILPSKNSVQSIRKWVSVLVT